MDAGASVGASAAQHANAGGASGVKAAGTGRFVAAEAAVASMGAKPAAVNAARAGSAGAGRFAPSPSGDLHVGNLRTAILAWVWARRTGRSFVMRIEDIDTDRDRPEAAQRQLADLRAVGIDWDGDVLFQSARHQAYADAVQFLREHGLLFECFCSRKDIREASSAPHATPGQYPGTCLRLTEAQKAEKRALFARQHRKPALRFKAEQTSWTIHDELHGDVTGPVDHFVIQRGSGDVAYNLAVTIDDAFQGVDQVCRGDDLLSQAPAQSCLAHVLGLPPVSYVHVPLAVNTAGARLAKRDGAVTVSDLRGLGWSIADIVGLIGASLGVPGARRAADILNALDVGGLRELPRQPWVVDPWKDLPQRP